MPTTTFVYLLMGRIPHEDGPDETWVHSVYADEDSAYNARNTAYQLRFADIVSYLDRNPKFIVPQIPIFFVQSFELQS